MANLSEIVKYLDGELRTSQIPDYSAAHNGLQLENRGEIKTVAAAVDASLSVIEEAVARQVDLLIVHHGLFWQGVRMLTGAQYQKFKLAFDNNLAIYSSHIPLDIHPSLGNNALLAKAIGLDTEDSFLDWKGIQLGLSGVWEGTFAELKQVIEKEAGLIACVGDNHALVGRLGLITGGAGSEVEAVKSAGIDTFITGEGPHWSFPLAEELGLKVIHAGHYATETFGVRALASKLEKKFTTTSVFIDSPTGL